MNINSLFPTFATIFMDPIHHIFPELTTPKRIAITMHQKPDADAMGSAIGLYHFLYQLGHNIQVISPTNWARFLDWMPGVEKVLDYELHKNKADEFLNTADWLFCLDFNQLNRTKAMTQKLEEITCTKILIDHHERPDLHAFQYGISSAGKSSTCELVYDFIVDSGNRDKINNYISESLYAGVVADTGSFRYSSTHGSVHHMVAYLKDQGLEHTKVHESLYDNFLENRLRFLGHVLTNRMDIFYELNTALISIPKLDILKYQIKTGDTEGLVNYPLSIQGIKLVGCVIDRDEERKWSFRSKGNFDCSTFAKKYFSGGGHYNASGGRDNESLQTTVQKFIRAINENKSILQ